MSNDYPVVTLCGSMGTRIQFPSGNMDHRQMSMPPESKRPQAVFWLLLGAVIALLIAGIAAYVLGGNSGEQPTQNHNGTVSTCSYVPVPLCNNGTDCC